MVMSIPFADAADLIFGILGGLLGVVIVLEAYLIKKVELLLLYLQNYRKMIRNQRIRKAAAYMQTEPAAFLLQALRLSICFVHKAKNAPQRA